MNIGIEFPERIVHLGFGKTATTTLQLHIFPRVAEQFGFEYIDVGDRRLRLHASRLNLQKDVQPIETASRFIASAEDLHSWDPYFWGEWADKNLEFFGSQSHVLLTIREPRGYLTSLYLQACLHQGNVQSADDLFLDEQVYSPYLASPKFAICHFGYQRFIDIYRKRFSAVSVVKFESLPQMSFLRELFPLTEVETKIYREVFAIEKVNPSYSRRAVNLTVGIQKILANLDLSLNPVTVRNSLTNLHLLKEWYLKNTMETKANNREQANGRGILSGKIKKYMGRFRWSALMHYVDALLPCEKFSLDFNRLPQIAIQQLEAEYRQLPELITFRKDA